MKSMWPLSKDKVACLNPVFLLISFSDIIWGPLCLNFVPILIFEKYQRRRWACFEIEGHGSGQHNYKYELCVFPGWRCWIMPGN